MGIHLEKLIRYKDDKIKFTAQNVDFKKLGEKKFSDLNFFPVAGLSSTKHMKTVVAIVFE